MDTCGHEVEEYYLHSKCHPQAPTWAVATPNALRIICSVCDKTITEFEMGEKPESGDAKTDN